MTSPVRDAALAGFPVALADLGALVRIPSIAFAGFDASEVHRSAAAVAALAEQTGVFDSVTVTDAPLADGTRGMPAVLATRAARAGKPTILLYAHHDVQPVGDESRWDSPPFQPTVRAGRLYGRGAADDKAGIVVHLAAIRALASVTDGDFDLGIALFIEGEEEAGSGSFAQFLDENAQALQAEVIVVADSGNWDESTPGLTVSLRGGVRFTLTVRTLAHASHSGMFGGAVPDATMATVRLLATLWDEAGSVAVAGLVSREARTPEYPEAALREDAGLSLPVTPIGTGSIASRLWNQPAVTITGIDAPSVRNASNTLAPEVSVVISARVAPGQPAREAFRAIEAHLRAHAPFGAELEFSQLDLGEGVVIDTSGGYFSAARDVLREGYGREPVELGIGGSIPFIADLAQRFPRAEILVTGVEDPGSRAHSPNESLHLDTFRSAIVSEALLLERLNAESAPRR